MGGSKGDTQIIHYRQKLELIAERKYWWTKIDSSGLFTKTKEKLMLLYIWLVFINAYQLIFLPTFHVPLTLYL